MFLYWFLLFNYLNKSEVLCRKGLDVEFNFRLCKADLENADHIFRRRPFVVSIGLV